MKHQHASAEEIRRTLLSRINSGQYCIGERIPPARSLADEFSANRNTVNKAFQELAREGIVSLVPGRGGGTFVQRADSPSTIATHQLRTTIQPLITHARTMGLSKAQLSEVISHVIEETYDAQKLRIKFLECNPHDAHELVQQLSPLIDNEIEPGVIDQENLLTIGEQFDLIVTTFHHLAEVSRVLGSERRKVIGINAVPTADVALKIALLEARRIGLVCGRENTVRSLQYLIGSYHPDNELDIVLVDDIEGVRALANRSEALIVTYSCADAVAELTERRPDVVVEFQIDTQSIEFLRQRVARLQAKRAPLFASIAD